MGALNCSPNGRCLRVRLRPVTSGNCEEVRGLEFSGNWAEAEAMARELESPWMAGEYGDDCSPSRAIEWQHPCQYASSAQISFFADNL